MCVWGTARVQLKHYKTVQPPNLYVMTVGAVPVDYTTLHGQNSDQHSKLGQALSAADIEVWFVLAY